MKRKLIAVTVLLLMIFTFGCEAYVEHDKNFESVVGKWNLDCVYKDAHPTQFKDESITINADGSGIYTTLVTDENGVTAEKSTALTASSGTNSAGEATIKLIVDGVETEYTFSVDIPAQLLHLRLIQEDGAELHYIYANDLIEY